MDGIKCESQFDINCSNIQQYTTTTKNNNISIIFVFRIRVSVVAFLLE